MVGEKKCVICGEPFIARTKKQEVCYKAECRREIQRIRQREYRRNHFAEVRERKRERRHKKQHPELYTTKPDNIVAIGYAERQMAQTLEMVGKVKV